ncbi:MAG: anthranilate synthase component I family protein [Cyclobacteriaceae bacterium]
MIRKQALFSIVDMNDFLARALTWADTFSHFSYFQSNAIDYPFGAFPHILFVGASEVISGEKSDVFSDVRTFHAAQQDYLTGFFGYDLKNQIEDLESHHPDPLDSAPFCFFRPLHILIFSENSVRIHSADTPSLLFDAITSSPLPIPDQHTSIGLKAHMSRKQYLEKFDKIRWHIEEGDVYELNLCMAFTGEADISPVYRYLELNSLSPAPFSVLQKTGSHYLLSASPERFIRRAGNSVLSQPIKGTAPRGITPEEDEKLKKALRHNEKELAENMMIADLVRNDLARTAIPGSVRAEELFGIYSFRQVHQMITSISSEVSHDTHWTDIIRNAFPMGSMTGAPKVMAMRLIEQYEHTRRGMYSGAAGFVTPEGDFDFNVVIRSLIYNADTHALGFQVGSAITYDADGPSEYDECLLKATALCKMLGADISDFYQAD